MKASVFRCSKARTEQRIARDAVASLLLGAPLCVSAAAQQLRGETLPDQDARERREETRQSATPRRATDVERNLEGTGQVSTHLTRYELRGRFDDVAAAVLGTC